MRDRVLLWVGIGLVLIGLVGATLSAAWATRAGPAPLARLHDGTLMQRHGFFGPCEPGFPDHDFGRRFDRPPRPTP